MDRTDLLVFDLEATFWLIQAHNKPEEDASLNELVHDHEVRAWLPLWLYGVVAPLVPMPLEHFTGEIMNGDLSASLTQIHDEAAKHVFTRLLKMERRLIGLHDVFGFSSEPPEDDHLNLPKACLVRWHGEAVIAAFLAALDGPGWDQYDAFWQWVAAMRREQKPVHELSADLPLVQAAVLRASWKPEVLEERIQHHLSPFLEPERFQREYWLPLQSFDPTHADAESLRKTMLSQYHDLLVTTWPGYQPAL